MLGGLNAIENSDALDKELENDKLLKQDVEKVVAMITPYKPAFGIVSAGITVGKQVIDHKYNKISDGLAKGPFAEKPPLVEKVITPTISEGDLKRNNKTTYYDKRDKMVNNQHNAK